MNKVLFFSLAGLSLITMGTFTGCGGGSDTPPPPPIQSPPPIATPGGFGGGGFVGSCGALPNVGQQINLNTPYTMNLPGINASNAINSISIFYASINQQLTPGREPIAATAQIVFPNLDEIITFPVQNKQYQFCASTLTDQNIGQQSLIPGWIDRRGNGIEIHLELRGVPFPQGTVEAFIGGTDTCKAYIVNNSIVGCVDFGSPQSPTFFRCITNSGCFRYQRQGNF